MTVKEAEVKKIRFEMWLYKEVKTQKKNKSFY